MRIHWTVLILLLTCLAALFGFGSYFPVGAPAAQVLFYALLPFSFIASFATLLRAR